MVLTLLSQGDSLRISNRGLPGKDGNDGLPGVGYLGARERPGDVRELFTTSLSGAAEDVASLAIGESVINEDGRVLRVPGSGAPITIATRQDFAVEIGQLYVGRWAVRRCKNTSDPYGDAVEFRVAWLDAQKNLITSTAVALRAVVVADGRFSASVTFGRGHPDAELNAPSATRYARLYQRILGGDHVTDVEVIDRHVALGAPGPKGDAGAEPEYILDEDAETIRWRQADGSIGPELDIGSARKRAEAARDIAEGFAGDIVAQGNVPIYGSRTEVQTYDLSGKTVIEIDRWDASARVAPAKYIRASSEPAHPGKVRDVTGAWWERSGAEVSVADFGAKGDDTADDTQSFQRAHDYIVSLGGGEVRIPPGNYRVQGVRFKKGVRWVGAGPDATFVKIKTSPAAGVGVFEVENDGGALWGIGFSDMAIHGDGVSSLFVPSGATVPGINFRTNVQDEEINQCLFDNLFIRYCSVGLDLWRSVRFAPITNCRFWNNTVGLAIGNEHPYLGAGEFRYNDVGMTGVVQDMDIVGTRFAYNKIGCNASISRSSFVSCKFWQNRQIAIDNVLEYNTFDGCLFRGANTFWSNSIGEPNESVCIGLFSRGTRVTSSLFFGGNGKAAVELRSNNPQHSISIDGCIVVLDTGHFMEKTGTGALSGASIKDTDFLVLSVGDGNGGMGLRVPDNRGAMLFFSLKDCFVRNENASQVHNFIDHRHQNSGGHQFKGNTFQAQSGISGGIQCWDNSSCLYAHNTFRTGSYLDKINIRSAQAGLVIKDNVGYATEGSASVSIPAGQTFVEVAHGLDLVPVLSSFVVSPASGAAAAVPAWISNLTSSSLRVNIPAAQATALTYHWNVNACRFI